jgi:GntR family transcriptional regulator
LVAKWYFIGFTKFREDAMHQSVSGQSAANAHFVSFFSAVEPLARAHARRQAPRYVQLHDAVKDAIDFGLLSDGDIVPPEDQLSSTFGLSTRSVRLAFKHLRGEGLLTNDQGGDLRVSGRIAAPLSVSSGFSKDASLRGVDVQSRIIGQNHGEPTANEIDMLELSDGDLVSRVHRVRYAGNKPVCAEVACLPAAILPKDEKISSSLYDYLSQKHMRPVRAVQRMRAEIMPAEIAKIMSMKTGAPCLFVEQQSFLSSGAPVEYVRTHYNGDACDFIVETKVVG